MHLTDKPGRGRIDVRWCGTLFDRQETEAAEASRLKPAAQCCKTEPTGEPGRPCAWPLASTHEVQSRNLSKGMILAQNERWQRALHMQVERETPLRRGSKAAEG
jgi:hypothetical protein